MASDSTVSQMMRRTEKTQEPQSRPAPVLAQTWERQVAPASTEATICLSPTTAQWHTITFLSDPTTFLR